MNVDTVSGRKKLCNDKERDHRPFQHDQRVDSPVNHSTTEAKEKTFVHFGLPGLIRYPELQGQSLEF